MGTEDVKVTPMNMYKYKERLRLYKRWPCSTYILNRVNCLFPSVRLTLTWFIWDRNLALHITLYSVNSVHVHCRDFNIFSSHGLLPSDLVAQSVERRRSNPKVLGSIPTLVRVFLCPCVGPFPSVGLTLTWFIWDRNLALHITLYSVNSV